MKLALDRYANLDSLIHRWEQRSKLVALLALIFAFALCDHVVLIVPMLMITAILYRLSRLPLKFLLHRLRYPGLFIAAAACLLPFASTGNVWFTVGPVAVKWEGVMALLLIAGRFLAILTISVILFSTAPFVTTIRALRSLRLPGIVADMTLLALRYVEEFAQTKAEMERAMRLRGFRVKRWSLTSLRVLSGLAGSLLIRSYNRSERIYQAMRLRGYGQELRCPPQGFAPDLSEADPWSQVCFWSILLLATAFVAATVLF